MDDEVDTCLVVLIAVLGGGASRVDLGRVEDLGKVDDADD